MKNWANYAVPTVDFLLTSSINDDLVRVTGKKIDDLQTVIQASKGWELGIPLQYENMRS